MADHVPAEARRHGGVGSCLLSLEEFVDLRSALGEHLHARLAQVSDAELKNLTNLLGRSIFGDGDECDFVGLAIGLLAGGRDSVPDFAELIRQRRSFGHAILLWADLRRL